MSTIIAGGGGFIGTNFAKKIAEIESEIFILDNFSNSNNQFLKILEREKKVNIIKCELSNYKETYNVIGKIINSSKTKPKIWHFAANSDIAKGSVDSTLDLKNTFMTTFNLLKTCNEFMIKSFYFSSSSAIYGDHGSNFIGESTGPLMPISNYGAMKLASEAICFSSFESFLKDLRIFRFPNVVGAPATHGVIFDFIKKLNKNPNELQVLGDGKQEKSYLHVEDLIDCMLFLSNRKLKEKEFPIYNIGTKNNPISVKWIAEQTVKFISPKAKIIYQKSKKGWVGDIPKFNYDTSKITNLGWIPSLNSKDAILKAIKEINFQINCL